MSKKNLPFLKIDIERVEMNKKKKKTNLERLYERKLKEYDKDHPGMRSLMRQINADKKCETLSDIISLDK